MNNKNSNRKTAEKDDRVTKTMGSLFRCKKAWFTKRLRAHSCLYIKEQNTKENPKNRLRADAGLLANGGILAAEVLTYLTAKPIPCIHVVLPAGIQCWSRIRASFSQSVLSKQLTNLTSHTLNGNHIHPNNPTGLFALTTGNTAAYSWLLAVLRCSTLSMRCARSAPLLPSRHGKAGAEKADGVKALFISVPGKPSSGTAPQKEQKGKLTSPSLELSCMVLTH